MKIKILNSLLIIDIVTISLIFIIMLLPSSLLRIILGLPFLIFFPGYVLVEALFLRGKDKDDLIKLTMPDQINVSGMDSIKRLILSFGMSIPLTALIGLILNYTPWGITLLPILIFEATLIIILSVVALIRQSRLNPPIPWIKEFTFKFPGWEGTVLNKTLTVVLATVILGTMGILIYTLSFPKMGEIFTEFYIMGRNGVADNYPSDFIFTGNNVILINYDDIFYYPDDFGRVTLGIVNHEQAKITYSIMIQIDGQPVAINYNGQNVSELENIDLNPDEKWQQQIGFTPNRTGDNQKVDFILYENGTSNPKDTLHLWIDVTSN